MYYWTGGSFVGIAYRIARDSRLMGGGFFAAMISLFNIFLGIVPCGATGRHRKRHKHSRDNESDKQSSKRARTQKPTYENRDDDGDERGKDHLFDGGFGGNVDGFGIVG